jgi:nitrogen fixation protein NifU and related proteins
MSDNSMRELYQEVILDHNKNPRNFRVMDDANRHAEGNNPLCGDKVDVYLRVGEGDKIEDVSFQGSGCAISKSSASLMTTILKGKSVTEADELFDKFRAVMTSGPGAELSDEKLEELGKLGVFAGVRDYPARVKCASLAWHAVHAALANIPVPVSTE